jgi:hypothetical protein
MTDERHRQCILEQLRRDQLALFIGSDLPREVTGLPARADLARNLARRYGLDESMSLAEVAQRVGRAGNRFDFISFLKEELDTAGKSPQSFHKRVVELAETHVVSIVTTAYDDLLERAFREAGVAFNYIVRSADMQFITPNCPTLFKIYGDLQQVDTLVVTEDDHFGLWRDRDKENVLEEIQSVLRRDTILFLGYDLSDPDFSLLWREVLERAGRFARTVYAVWPGLSEEEVQVWRDRQIVILAEDPLELLSMGYAYGLEMLDAQLERTGRYPEFDVLQSQALETLAAGREPGEALADGLDRLARQVLGLGFTDLALGRIPPRMQTSARALSLVQQLRVNLTPDVVEPPVQPRLQALPFNDLAWEQFEALCAALVEANPLTVGCNLYGVQGDFQQGIDVIATQRSSSGDETWAYQCKRYKSYTPAQLRKALDKATYPADYYVLMLSIPATAAMREVADRRSNAFLWDARDIARKLKSYPAIVEDFFGPMWREAFCGEK